MNNQEIKKYFRQVFGFLTFLVVVIGCDSGSDEDDNEIGNWRRLSYFEGVGRADAVTFTIGDKAYVGTGYDGSSRLNDFWEYDPKLNNWQRIADFPGAARNGAVGFGTGAKGYVGLGYDGINRLKDFWEYDPTTDTWNEISDFGGTARYGAVAFSIDNKGYVGTGYDGNNLKDFWEYDPSTDQWTQKISLPGAKRYDAVAFVINGKGYICTGINNGIYEDDFWEYDPATNQWSAKRRIADVSDENYDDDYTDIVGTNKVAFSINGKGYIATAGRGGVGTAVWEYDPLTDLWERKNSFEGSARTEAVGFSIEDVGYVTTGRSASFYFDDLWGFEPDVEQEEYLYKMFIISP